MRNDMSKVIVERPRRGGLTTHASRRFRNDEERSGKIGIRRDGGGIARRDQLD